MSGNHRSESDVRGDVALDNKIESDKNKVDERLEVIGKNIGLGG